MNFKQTLLRFACISLMVTGAGCYSHSPYGYGGYPNSMGGAYPQGGVIQSPGSFGPTVVPESTFQQGQQPTLADPNNTNNLNNAPDYNDEFSNENENGVPDPEDNNSFEGSPNDNFSDDKFEMENNDLDAPANDDYFDESSSPTGSTLNNSGVEQVAYSSNQFKEPRRFTPMASTTHVNKQIPIKKKHTSAYGYDKEMYSWLKGTVDYDSDHGTWHIMYNIKPEIDDQFGGEFAMSNHAGLKKLKDGDVVFIKGYVDDSDRDVHGKVIYQVEELKTLRK